MAAYCDRQGEFAQISAAAAALRSRMPPEVSRETHALSRDNLPPDGCGVPWVEMLVAASEDNV